MISKEDRIKGITDSYFKRIEEYAAKYEDINNLYNSYKSIKEQDYHLFTDQYCDGYLACISDLIYEKMKI